MVAAIRRNRRGPHDQWQRIKFMNTQTLQVFDPAMCCSTGVCGPSVDSKLVQFAADLDWLKAQGVIVQRFNLAQNAAAFVQNPAVKSALASQGEGALPLLLVNGQIAIAGRHPARGELASLLGLRMAETPAVTKSGCCCGGTC